MNQVAKEGREPTENEWWALEHYGMHDSQTQGLDPEDFAPRIQQAMQSGQGKKLKFNLDQNPLEGHELAVPGAYDEKEWLNERLKNPEFQTSISNNPDYHAFLREGLQQGFDPLNIGHLLPQMSIHPLDIDTNLPGDQVMHHVEVRGPSDIMQQMRAALMGREESMIPGEGPKTLQAEGGRVGMAEGDQPEGKQPDPEIAESLASLKQGLSLKGAGKLEDPESPFTNILGEVGGGALATGALLAGLRYPGATARFMERHPHLTASGAGALAGGMAGQAGSGDFWTGAGTGAMLGPMISNPMLGYKHFEGLAPRLARLSSQYTRPEFLGGMGAGPGMREAIQTMEADKPGGGVRSVADQLARDAQLGIQSTAAEAAGPRSVGLTLAALRKDVPASNVLLRALEEREAGMPEATQDIIRQAFPQHDYYTTTEQLRNNLYTKAAPLYEQAYSQFPSVKTQQLYQIMNTPSGQEAAARAFRMMQDMQIPIGSPDVTGMVQNPSLQYLDQVKRALDDMIIKEEGSGMNYQATQQGRVLRDMRSKFVNELDQATQLPNGQSPYRQARDQYAGDLDVMDALRSGRETFDKLTPEEVRQLMTKLDWSSRDAYRIGVAEGIMQKIGNMRGNRDAAMAAIANPNLQAKIMAIFDKPEEGQRFIDTLNRQSEVFSTGRQMIKTGQAGLRTSAQPTSISQMLRGQLMRKGTAGDISETMGTMANDPQAKQKMARLQATANALRNQKEMSRLGAAAIAGGAATAATPSPQINQGQ
jgi:hypothetical protein